jgi:hypothetical protein
MKELIVVLFGVISIAGAISIQQVSSAPLLNGRTYNQVFAANGMRVWICYWE